MSSDVDRAPRRELALFGLAYLVYLTGRWLTAGDHATAVAHAHRVLSAERSLGVSIERPVQQAFDVDVARTVFSYVYLAAQLVVVPCALVATYRSSRRVYRVLRDTIVATWLIAIPVYAAFPVAPPRLAAAGVSDTVSGAPVVAMTGRSTLFYNQYAAVPSLHVGFACAVGAGLAATARHPVTRAVSLTWGAVVALVVVATGNHYVLDLGAGVAVTLLGYGIGAFFRRLPRLPVLHMACARARNAGAAQGGLHRLPPPAV
jgi:hypothetical protein